MTLSEKIQHQRKQVNLSQEQLAEKLGVSRQAVSKWETGESSPEIDKILLLKNIFNVSADYLLDNNAENSVISNTKNTNKWFFSTISILAVVLLFTTIYFGSKCVSLKNAKQKEQSSAVLPSVKDPVADFSYTIVSKNRSNSTLTLELALTPTVFTDDLSISFMAVYGSKSITQDAKLGNGTVYTSTVIIPWVNEFTISAIFNDTTGKFTQPLIKIFDVYENGYAFEERWK